jgi:hypothetical protein
MQISTEQPQGAQAAGGSPAADGPSNPLPLLLSRTNPMNDVNLGMLNNCDFPTADTSVRCSRLLGGRSSNPRPVPPQSSAMHKVDDRIADRSPDKTPIILSPRLKCCRNLEP